MVELSIETPLCEAGVEEFMNRVSRACFEAEGVCEMVCGARLVDDEQIHRINLRYRGVDRPTDVISFPAIEYRPGVTARGALKRLRREYDPDRGAIYIGDFVISMPRAQEQARAYGHSLAREVGFLTAHAHFHLMGYDHETEQDRRAMRAMEERVMRDLRLMREEG